MESILKVFQGSICYFSKPWLFSIILSGFVLIPLFNIEIRTLQDVPPLDWS